MIQDSFKKISLLLTIILNFCCYCAVERQTWIKDTQNGKFNFEKIELTLPESEKKIGILKSEKNNASDDLDSSQQNGSTDVQEGNLPNILYMWGWGGAPAGISYDDEDVYVKNLLLSNRNKFLLSEKFRLFQMQWPGCEITIKTSAEEVKISSDEIKKADYLNIGEYYANCLKELKDKLIDADNELYVVAHSNGALKALLGYISITKERREGIKLIIVDPFLPSESAIIKGIFPAFIIDYSLKLMNFLRPRYDGSFTDSIIYPLTIITEFMIYLIERIFNLMINFFIDCELKTKNFFDMILGCYEDEKKLFSKLSSETNGSLNITNIVFTKPTEKNLAQIVNDFLSEIAKDSINLFRTILGDSESRRQLFRDLISVLNSGFGSLKPYRELFEEKIGIKCKKETVELDLLHGDIFAKEVLDTILGVINSSSSPA